METLTDLFLTRQSTQIMFRRTTYKNGRKGRHVFDKNLELEVGFSTKKLFVKDYNVNPLHLFSILY